VAGAVAAALAVLAVAGIAGLAAGVFAVQVVVALAWLAALDAKGSVGAFAIAVVAAGVVDVAVALGAEPDIGRAAPVAGLAFLASLVHQLARRPRRGLTVSLAATMSTVAFTVCAASYVALVHDRAGYDAVAAGAVGIAVALLAARLLDLAVARPGVYRGSRRGVVGVVVGVAGAAAAGAVWGAHSGGISEGVGLRMAMVGALLALIADIAVDAVLTQAPPRDERRLSALTPLGVLLPVVLAAPVVYVAGRILLHD
jgi:hypothetical protein